MKVSCWRAVSGCLIALIVVTAIGCGGSDAEIVVPNKPPLSYESAMEKAKKQQQEKLKSLQSQAMRKAKR